MPKGEKSRKLTDEQRAEVMRIYTTPNPDGTWTGTKSIARQFGVRQNAIYTLLQRFGIPTRTSAQAFANHKRTKPIKNVPQGAAPACKCGCGEPARWNQRKNHWNVFAAGHRRPPHPYKDSEWLRHEYEILHRSAQAIGREFGAAPGTVSYYLKKFGIPIRTTSESLILGGKTRGANNPAWKGGIAQWAYAPNWKRVARAIRKRDNYTCQKCNTQFPKSSRLLHVHHIDGHKFNNSPDNLATVCATCHPKGKRKETRVAFST